MNPIQTRLVADMKAAMKAGEKDRLSVIRLLIAALKDAQMQGADDTMDEAAELDVLRKQVKSRRDSVDQALAAGRQDIADKEQAEIVVIEAYLPAMLKGDALLAKVREVAAEIGYQGPQDKGRFMKAWMGQHRDLAEGRDVQAALGQLEGS